MDVPLTSLFQLCSLSPIHREIKSKSISKNWVPLSRRNDAILVNGEEERLGSSRLSPQWRSLINLRSQPSIKLQTTSSNSWHIPMNWRPCWSLVVDLEYMIIATQKIQTLGDSPGGFYDFISPVSYSVMATGSAPLATMPSVLSLPHTPTPCVDLREFTPFISRALHFIHDKLEVRPLKSIC